MEIVELIRQIVRLAKDGKTSKDFQAIRLLAKQILKSLEK